MLVKLIIIKMAIESNSQKILEIQGLLTFMVQQNFSEKVQNTSNAFVNFTKASCIRGNAEIIFLR